MAKKNSKAAGTENAGLTDEKKNAMGVESFNFDDAEGETFAGLNIVKLKAGEADGPFVLKEILPNQKLGTNKKMKPVDVYVGTKAGVQVRMPIAASFTQKAKDAKLAVGDTFAVKRDADYIAKKYGKQNCASYQLKVLTRAS